MTQSCDVKSETRMGISLKMVRTLSDISSSAVAELLTKCLIASESEGRGIGEYCDILRPLGLIQNVADRTFDKLSQVKKLKTEKGIQNKAKWKCSDFCFRRRLETGL